MRWLAATVGLLLASIALVSFVYFRDRNTTDWHPPDLQAASADAQLVLSIYDSHIHCGGHCEVALIGPPQSRRWLAQMRFGGQTRCVRIDLTSFSSTVEHGLQGVEPADCPADS